MAFPNPFEPSNYAVGTEIHLQFPRFRTKEVCCAARELKLHSCTTADFVKVVVLVVKSRVRRNAGRPLRTLQ
jgi:hypothetical protein